ncbi:MAG: hypothetical protein KAH20_11480 [Methylococcales bacterium]|nr:hypothetical protein [Methylococcales bacterium]
MQTYLADIQKLIANWYQLTLDNLWYGVTTAAIVWLLAALLYNLKIFLLNKKKKSIDIQLSKAQTQLEEIELKLKESEETITTNADQLTEFKQLIEGFEEKSKTRNQKIIDNTKALASKFSLNEQIDESEEKEQDEFIWQQQDNIVEQLSERLAAEQQEKSALEITHQKEIEKLNDKESLTSNVQTMLDMQTKKFTQMLSEQNIALKQQTEEAQQHLSSISMLDNNNNAHTTVPKQPTVEPEDELIPDLIGPITFDSEEKSEPLSIKNLFDSEKAAKSIPSSTDSIDSKEETVLSSIDSIDTQKTIEEPAIQSFSSPKQEVHPDSQDSDKDKNLKELKKLLQKEQPEVIHSDNQDSDKDKNFRELKKLLNESKQDHKDKMTTELGKKPTRTPRKKKVVKQKTKSKVSLFKKVKGLIIKD